MDALKTIDTMSEAERQLDLFNLGDRLNALEWLSKNCRLYSESVSEQINMHIHSFFSYNANGFSPSHIAWEAHKHGLYAAGLCDFDVLDGIEEFLTAALMLQLRATVSLETRVFVSEYSESEINSPGEPGVMYIMGAGFARQPEEHSQEAITLREYRQQANNRNAGLVRRINAEVPEIAINYKKEVIPLTPGGCPTERHIVRAYRLKAESAFKHADDIHKFLATIMKLKPDEISELSGDTAKIEEKIRSALVKSGGIGYKQPTEETFPRADDFISWVRNCNAIPMVTWLDGTSPAEKHITKLLELMEGKGACALNIIPERNHNIADPTERTLRLKKLDEVIHTADERNMPINIGTEMNRRDQPFVNDTKCEALRPYHNIFLKGARIMIGHTLLSRFANFSYVGDKAEEEFGKNLAGKNRLFESAGSLPPLTLSTAGRLLSMEPGKALAYMIDAAKIGRWSN